MRTAVLSLMMLSAVLAGGAGIYTATASDALEATDGYGITTFVR